MSAQRQDRRLILAEPYSSGLYRSSSDGKRSSGCRSLASLSWFTARSCSMDWCGPRWIAASWTMWRIYSRKNQSSINRRHLEADTAVEPIEVAMIWVGTVGTATGMYWRWVCFLGTWAARRIIFWLRDKALYIVYTLRRRNEWLIETPGSTIYF